MKLYKNYNSLGFNNPYYFNDKEGKIVFKEFFNDIINEFNDDIIIDITAVNQVLSLNFMLGDRTLIKDIYKSPWMAIPNIDLTAFNFKKIDKHDEILLDESQIATKLYSLLREEVKAYVGSSKTIGILLSGGMDSRIVAAILNDLILDQEIKIDSVTGYTWGNLNSRDVVYSERICNKLGWKFNHYQVTADDLWNNIEVAAFNGCEYSGLHLHAIPQIVKDLDVEVMLAGSFGDSIGRAEYSGRNVTNLVPLFERRRNFSFLFNKKAYSATEKAWKQDIESYHQKHKEDKEYQQNELDYQLHYMRRMLNPCIGLLNEKCNVFQAFTTPEIFQFIWSIDPKYRTDEVYFYILKLFKTDFSDIPWARTGLPYGLKTGTPDNFKKEHHSYKDYILNDLFTKIENEIQSGLIYDYIEEDSVNVILNMVKKFPNHNFDYLERLTWLASFSLFLKNNDLKIKGKKKVLKSTSLTLKSLVALRYLIIYTIRKLRI